MSTNIDELSIKITSDADKATSGIDSLTASLEKLKTAVSGIKNLKSVANGVTAIATAVATIDQNSKLKLESLAKGLNSLSSVNGVKGVSLANQINQLKDAVNGLSSVSTTSISTMVSALNTFSTVSLPNISSYGTAIKNLSTSVKSLSQIDSNSLTDATDAIREVADASQSFAGMSGSGFSTITKSLKEIPKITENLDDSTVVAFAEACQKVSDAVRPLTSELSSVSPAVAQLMLKLVSVSNTEDTTTRATNALEDATASLKEELLALVPGLGTVLSVAKTAGETFQKVIRTVKSAVNTIKNIWNTLKNVFNKIKSVLSSIATAIGNVLGGIVDTAKKAISGTISTVKSLFNTSSEDSGLIQSFTDIYTMAQSVYSVVTTLSNTLSDFVNKSADYEEMMNMFAVAMGNAAQAGLEYAQTVQNAVGINAADWMENEAIFMNVVHGYGVASDRAAIMSQQLTQIGYDLSSIWNEDVATAMQKLQSGIAGEIEPLRRWGVDLSQARLEQEALTLGIDESISSMTQAEKAQLRYISIFNQVSEQGVLGDMAKTINSSANQMRVFAAQIELVGRSIGNVLIPIINKVLPYVIALVKAVRSVIDTIAGFFGYQLPTVSDYGVSVGDTVSDLASDTSDLADATGSAAEAAEEYKNTVLGIDELNLLNDTSSSSGGGSGGSGSGSGVGGASDWDFDIPTYDFLAKLVETNADTILDNFKKLDEFDWVGLRTKIHTAMTAIADSFTKVVDGIPYDTVGEFIGEAFNTYNQAINTFWYKTNKVDENGLTAWQRLGKNISKGLRTFVETVEWKSVGMKLRYKMNSLLDMFSQAVKEFNTKGKNGLTGFEEVGQAIADYLSGVFDINGKGKSVFSKVAETLTNTIKGIATTASTAIKSLNSRVGVNGTWFQTLGDSIGSALSNAFSNRGLFHSVATAVDNFIGDEQSGVLGIITSALDNMSANRAWEQLGHNFSESIETVFSADNFKGVVSSVSTTFKGIFSTVGTTLNDLNNSGYFKGVGTTLAEMLGGAFSEGGIFTTLSETIGSAFGSAVDLLNGFVAKMNSISGASGMTGWEELGTGIANSFNNIFTSDNVAGFTSGITQFATGIVTSLKTAMGDAEVQRKLEEMVTSITESIVEVIKSDEVQSMLLTAMSTTCSVISASLSKSHPFLAWLFENAADTADTKANWDESWNGELADVISNSYQNGGTGLSMTDAQRIVAARHTKSDGQLGNVITNIKSTAKKQANAYVKQWNYTIDRSLTDTVITTVNTDAKTTANGIVTDVNSIMSGTAFKANTINTDAKTTAKGITSSIQTYANDHSVKVNTTSKTSGYAFTKNIQSKVDTSGTSVKLNTNSKTSGYAFVEGVQRAVNDYGGSVKVGVYATGLVDSIKAQIDQVKAKIVAETSGKVVNYASLTMKAFAAGGFPSEGQMFIAREAGPELVGTIGGRTAVANNDQIVTAVANGVASANAEETALLREQNRLLRALLAKDTTVTVSASQIVNGINRASTRSGVSAF